MLLQRLRRSSKGSLARVSRTRVYSIAWTRRMSSISEMPSRSKRWFRCSTTNSVKFQRSRHTITHRCKTLCRESLKKSVTPSKSTKLSCRTRSPTTSPRWQTLRLSSPAPTPRKMPSPKTVSVAKNTSSSKLKLQTLPSRTWGPISKWKKTWLSSWEKKSQSRSLSSSKTPRIRSSIYRTESRK